MDVAQYCPSKKLINSVRKGRIKYRAKTFKELKQFWISGEAGAFLPSCLVIILLHVGSIEECTVARPGFSSLYPSLVHDYVVWKLDISLEFIVLTTEVQGEQQIHVYMVCGRIYVFTALC